MAQLHKRCTDEQVKDMLTRYLKREIEGPYIPLHRHQNSPRLRRHAAGSDVGEGKTVPV